MLLLQLILVAPLGLTPGRPVAVSRRGAVFAAASSFAASLTPALADSGDAPLFEVARDAADVIRSEGVLKSTGKSVPPQLLAAIVIGGAAATAGYFLGGSGDTPVPTGLASKRADQEAYEASKWTNNVELPWMQGQSEEADAAVLQDADEEE